MPASQLIFKLNELAELGYPGFSDMDRDELVRGAFLSKVRDPLGTYLNREYNTANLRALEIAAANFENGPKLT